MAAQTEPTGSGLHYDSQSTTVPTAGALFTETGSGSPGGGGGDPPVVAARPVVFIVVG